MKKKLPVEILSFVVAVMLVLPTACVKDRCEQQHTYTYYEPVYKTKADVRANIKSNAPREISTPGKIYIKGDYIFLNEVDRGIHVINNSNPAQPQRIAFIDIPGNVDLAVKGNILYADLYTDLVAIDITDPSSAKLTKVVEGVFPYRYWGGGFAGPASDMVVAEWVKRDTTVMQGCDQPNWWSGRGDLFFAGLNSAASPSSPASSSPIGTGGSMARFTIMNDRLYTVSYSDLDVFNITNTRDPYHTGTINLGWNIETIYPFRDKLFIGSQSGMFIYHVVNPDAPAAAGKFEHVRSCDPVVADEHYAYVTLRSGTACQGFTNQLEIVRLNAITDPVLQKTYPMENPHGLSKDGNTLFICDGAAGLKIYDAANVMDLKKIGEIKDIDTYDVIAFNKIALVVARDGLYQYNYTDPHDIRLLSKITVAK
jgi:hypothetical protein